MLHVGGKPEYLKEKKQIMDIRSTEEQECERLIYSNRKRHRIRNANSGRLWLL